MIKTRFGKMVALKYTLGMQGVMVIVFQSRCLRLAFVNRFEQIERMCIRQTFQRTLVFAWKIEGAWGLPGPRLLLYFDDDGYNMYFLNLLNHVEYDS